MHWEIIITIKVPFVSLSHESPLRQRKRQLFPYVIHLHGTSPTAWTVVPAPFLVPKMSVFSWAPSIQQFAVVGLRKKISNCHLLSNQSVSLSGCILFVVSMRAGVWLSSVAMACGGVVGHVRENQVSEDATGQREKMGDEAGIVPGGIVFICSKSAGRSSFVGGLRK